MPALVRFAFLRFAVVAVLVVPPTLLVAGARHARADEPPAAPVPAPGGPPAAARREPPAEPALVEEMPVTTLLKNLSRTTGISISWGDQDKAVATKKLLVTGTQRPMSAEQTFDAARALLASAEIVLIRHGPIEGRMFVAMDARTLASQFILKAQPEVIEVTDELVPTLLGQGGRFVSATISVRHLTELRDARTALQRLITQNNIGSVQEVPAARAFVVADFAPNVAVIYRMIRQMDVPPAPTLTPEAKRTSPAYFALKHANAGRVEVLLQRLFPPKTATASAPTQVPGAPAGTAAGLAPDSPPRISSDEASNQVIVIANADDTAAIADIIRRVDVEAPK